MALILRLIDRIETFAMAFFFSAALVVGTSTVVARYVFNTGVTWSDQAFVKFTIWAALIGASRAVRDGLHVRVDLILYIPYIIVSDTETLHIEENDTKTMKAVAA